MKKKDSGISIQIGEKLLAISNYFSNYFSFGYASNVELRFARI